MTMAIRGRWFTLTTEEIKQAEDIAREWSRNNRDLRTEQRLNTRGRDMSADQLMGIKGEIATARALSLPYVNVTSDHGRPDLGVAELRCRSLFKWGLVLSENDDHKAHYPWILAHHHKDPKTGVERIHVRSWAWGHEVFAQGSRFDIGGEKQWLADPDHPVLKPMEQLVAILPDLKAREAEMRREADALKAARKRRTAA